MNDLALAMIEIMNKADKSPRPHSPTMDDIHYKEGGYYKVITPIAFPNGGKITTESGE